MLTKLSFIYTSLLIFSIFERHLLCQNSCRRTHFTLKDFSLRWVGRRFTDHKYVYIPYLYIFRPIYLPIATQLHTHNMKLLADYYSTVQLYTNIKFSKVMKTLLNVMSRVRACRPPSLSTPLCRKRCNLSRSWKLRQEAAVAAAADDSRRCILC